MLPCVWSTNHSDYRRLWRECVQMVSVCKGDVCTFISYWLSVWLWSGILRPAMRQWYVPKRWLYTVVGTYMLTLHSGRHLHTDSTQWYVPIFGLYTVVYTYTLTLDSGTYLYADSTQWYVPICWFYTVVGTRHLYADSTQWYVPIRWLYTVVLTYTLTLHNGTYLYADST